MVDPHVNVRQRLSLSLAAHLAFLAAAAAVAVGAAVLAGIVPPSVLTGTVAGCAAVAVLAAQGLDGQVAAGRFGPANGVTLARGVLASIVAGAAAAMEELGPPLLWAVFGIGIGALALDGVDGFIARRTGLASPYGARLDATLDTFAIAVFSLLLWRHGRAGPWLLLAPALHPAFVFAGRLWPPLARPLPLSRRRRAVCAVALGALCACAAPVAPPSFTAFAAAAALALLLFSFALDTVWLLRNAFQPLAGASGLGQARAAEGSILTDAEENKS